MVRRRIKRKVFVEGSGDHNAALKTECRRGFSELFKKMGLRSQPRVVVCGGRSHAYDQFSTAVEGAASEDVYVLLVDSEEAVTAPATAAQPWLHVKNRVSDDWAKPTGC